MGDSAEVLSMIAKIGLVVAAEYKIEDERIARGRMRFCHTLVGRYSVMLLPPRLASLAEKQRSETVDVGVKLVERGGDEDKAGFLVASGSS